MDLSTASKATLQIKPGKPVNISAVMVQTGGCVIHVTLIPMVLSGDAAPFQTIGENPSIGEQIIYRYLPGAGGSMHGPETQISPRMLF